MSCLHNTKVIDTANFIFCCAVSCSTSTVNLNATAIEIRRLIEH